MRPKLGQRGQAGIKGGPALNTLLVTLLLAFLSVPALAAMPDTLTLQNANVMVLSALACETKVKAVLRVRAAAAQESLVDGGAISLTGTDELPITSDRETRSPDPSGLRS